MHFSKFVFDLKSWIYLNIQLVGCAEVPNSLEELVSLPDFTWGIPKFGAADYDLFASSDLKVCSKTKKDSFEERKFIGSGTALCEPPSCPSVGWLERQGGNITCFINESLKVK